MERPPRGRRHGDAPVPDVSDARQPAYLFGTAHNYDKGWMDSTCTRRAPAARSTCASSTSSGRRATCTAWERCRTRGPRWPCRPSPSRRAPTRSTRSPRAARTGRGATARSTPRRSTRSTSGPTRSNSLMGERLGRRGRRHRQHGPAGGRCPDRGLLPLLLGRLHREQRERVGRRAPRLPPGPLRPRRLHDREPQSDVDRLVHRRHHRQPARDVHGHRHRRRHGFHRHQPGRVRTHHVGRP